MAKIKLFFLFQLSKDQASKRKKDQSNGRNPKTMRIDPGSAPANNRAAPAHGTAHRKHASTYLIAKYFPNDKMFGYLMEKEVKAIKV